MKDNGRVSASAGDASPKRGSGYLSNRILVLLLLIILAVILHLQRLDSTSAMRSTSSTNGNNDPTSPVAVQRFRMAGNGAKVESLDEGASVEKEEDEDEADLIIRRSYQKSYAHILPCDANTSGQQCMKKTLDYIHSSPKDTTDVNNLNNTMSDIPWWFLTLLRDTQSNGAYGFWHHLYTAEPAFNFCAIGKVATTEWRNVFCQLNADDCKVPGNLCKQGCAWRTSKKMPEDAPWAVFLRDPLERLLSGFLDKCYNPAHRQREGHCEPNIVFKADPTLLMQNLEDHDKQMFAAYVDVLPLKWNVHFIPQAIVCDLHRTISTFDFVGHMGEDFMFDLEKMANHFGGQLPTVLNASFAYQEHVRRGKKNMGKDKSHHATHAPAKVQQFFTAQTVRRGLELLSIDYVTLELEVPEWARQMLRDDGAA